MSTGASTCTPAGTSTKTGSGAKASLSRTRASPPSCTAPSDAAAAGTSSARPKAKSASDAVKTLARPLCTSTLPATGPSAVVSTANNWSPAGAGPSCVGGANSSRSRLLMGVYRQTSSLSEGSWHEVRAS